MRFTSEARPRVSVITDPITGSINSQRNVRVNLHYGGILGDNYTPINSLESYKEKKEKFFSYRCGPDNFQAKDFFLSKVQIERKKSENFKYLLC